MIHEDTDLLPVSHANIENVNNCGKKNTSTTKTKPNHKTTISRKQGEEGTAFKPHPSFNRDGAGRTSV